MCYDGFMILETIYLAPVARKKIALIYSELPCRYSIQD